MPYLLDTNAWIHYLKDPSSAIRAELAARSPTDILLCAVVYYCLRYFAIAEFRDFSCFLWLILKVCVGSHSVKSAIILSAGTR